MDPAVVPAKALHPVFPMKAGRQAPVSAEESWIPAQGRNDESVTG